MSILINELEARKNDYILVADIIKTMAEATNSAPDEVIRYLDAHNIDEQLTLIYMDENYNFEPYEGYFLGLGNDANITYFQKSDVMSFEPITKHGIFKDERKPMKQSKAPPPANHIKASVPPFNQKTIGDVIKAEKQKEPILPNDYQSMTMLYDYFTTHQACCFMAGLHPNFNGSDDGLEIAKRIIKGGFKSGKLLADDDQKIDSDDLKSFLHSKNWIMKGFNDNLPNDTDKIPTPTVTQTQRPNNEQLIKELITAKAKISELESDLKQAEAKLIEKSAQKVKVEKQGDSLLILGAVMHCIKDAAKKNFTQDLLTQTILDRYKNVQGISESTLKKKYSEAKNYLEQRHKT